MHMRDAATAFAALAAVAALAAPAAIGQATGADGEAMLTVSGTLLSGGQPTAGRVHLTQYTSAYKPAYDAWADAGADGRFLLQAKPGLAVTNLAVDQGPDLAQASLRLRGDLDFEWPLDGQALGEAQVRIVVTGADGQDPGPSTLTVGDAFHGGRYYCVQFPGETEDTNPPPVSGAPSTSRPPPTPRGCPLTWTSPGVAEGRLPRGLLSLRAEDIDWAMCDWTLSHPDACQPYVPFEGSAAVGAAGANLTLALQRARPADTRLEGYYVSEVSGRPLPRKALFLDDGEARIVVVTDEDGSFRVGLPAGTYQVSATLCAHAPLDEAVALEAGSPRRQDFVQRADATPDSFDSGSYGATRTQPAPSYPACDASPTPTAAMASAGPGGDDAASSASPDVPASFSPSTGPAADDATAAPARPELVDGRLVLHYEGLGPIGGRALTEGSSDSLSAAPHGSPAALWPILGGVAAAVVLAMRRRLT